MVLQVYKKNRARAKEKTNNIDLGLVEWINSYVYPRACFMPLISVRIYWEKIDNWAPPEKK